jgi:hypothetical protein
MQISATLSEDQMVQLVVAGPLRSAQEVAEFLDTEECGKIPHSLSCERAIVIKNYQLAGLADTVSAWDEFLVVLGVVMQVAGVVTGVTSAISGVYALKSL